MGGGMRVTVGIVIIAITCSVAAQAFAVPLVTITCDKPNGFNLSYGVSFTERLNTKNEQEPNPSLKGPTKDGYAGKPTFVIDSDEKKMTVIWSELPEDVELRKKAKEMGLPQMPPPAAADAMIVWFSKDQISAIQAEPWSITTYSFFPKMGTAFIGQQSMDLGMKNSRQIATLAHCEFSWATGAPPK